MAHMSYIPGNHEIIEIEELNPGEHCISNNYIKPESRREEKDRRSLASNAGHISSLEDDLSHLFEMFNRRASSNGPSHSNQAGSSRKNSSKRPVKSGGSHSPGHGISERVNLKQALRGLCLSQASEMAALKRSMKSPRSSEAGKILTMYQNVVVDDSTSDYTQDDCRGGMLEISLVPEEVTFDSFQNFQEKSPASDLWPSNRSSLADGRTKPTTMHIERGFDLRDSGNQLFVQEKPTHPMTLPFSHADGNSPDKGHPNLAQNTMIMRYTETGSQASAEMLQKQKYLLQPASSSLSAKIGMQEVTKTNMRGNVKFPASVDSESQTSCTESSHTGKLASQTYSSRTSYGKNFSEFARKMPVHKEMDAAVVTAGNESPKIHLLYMEESVNSPHPWEHSKSGISEIGKCSSTGFSDQPSFTESLQNEKLTSLHLSRPSNSKTSSDLTKKMAEKELIPVSVVDGNQKKVAVMHKEDRTPVCSPRGSELGGRGLDQCKSSLGLHKLVSKAAAADSANVDTKQLDTVVPKESLKTSALTDSPKGKKVSKSTRNAKHFVKPIIKTRNFVKRKSKKKMVSENSSNNIRSEFNNDLYSSPNPIVCPRCQCVVTDAWKDVNKESSISHQEAPVSPQESPTSHQEYPTFCQDSPISSSASLSGEVSTGYVISDISTPGPISDSLNKSKTVLVESSGNLKTSNKAEFTQSSKGSLGECSTSTSVSEESNLSRPSFCDRPHMSKDVRWEAIRHIRFQYGTLGLRHFNLLKKLGCGDIGTVYLAELIGTNCLFAIKVMDNEFLARRKKISRAQTEKEILRMLDHPFLPTLYCQFTSDNLSCLVMEYCPGGDLHVLRQRQPGRCFTEQAARFYVAEVLLALEYLHMLGVVYRDLKPENILVREDGHIMLSDFDLSLRCAVNPTLLVSSSMSESSRKVSRPCVDSRCVQPLCIEPSCQVTCFTPRLRASSSKLKKMKSDFAAEMRPLLQLVAEPTSARSNSFVGTHEYLAPEIIKGEGHGSAVDWWTFGIFLYELLYGRTPFKGAGNEETLANVVLQSLKFPDSPLVSLQARDLISALLVKEPENRLGTERGAAEIKQHPFFDGLNWALIRCAVPPELPESRSLVMPKAVAQEKNKYESFGSGSGSAEHLEFEVF